MGTEGGEIRVWATFGGSRGKKKPKKFGEKKPLEAGGVQEKGEENCNKKVVQNTKLR